MAASQLYITDSTPMGANLAVNGATFKVWAPGANAVHILGDFNGWQKDDCSLLVKNYNGYWTGYIANVKDGDHYKFFVEGKAGSNFKRDPYARELSYYPKYPDCNCIVRDQGSYPWHDKNFHPPEFSDMTIYQLHTGTFYGPDRSARVAKFLDVLDRLEYFIALGINTVQLLPLTEFSSTRSMGYDGVDIFSPEMDYGIEPDDLMPYLSKINAILQSHGFPPLAKEQLEPQINQLKALVDILHINGIAVILDVVYNHAGCNIGDQAESLWFFDEEDRSNVNNSLYFTDQGHTGPVFAFWKKEVRQFLIDNASFLSEEYHTDGFRYDQVSVIVKQNTNDGWKFCQNLTSTIRYIDPENIQIAEYWSVDPYVVKPESQGGAGFDAAWDDGLRIALRNAVQQSSYGKESHVDMDSIAGNLYPAGFPDAWKAVRYIESHDEVYHDRNPRIASLADPGNARSWYARSRARFANGILLTAPGIPMLFMGQEFLEDKRWSDNPDHSKDSLIWWEGLEMGDKSMTDHLRFMQDLLKLRKEHPALRSNNINVIHVHNDNRVIVYHRWAENAVDDVIIVGSLNESTLYDYQIGLPAAGEWKEIFNSDVYDNWVNPWCIGNKGKITAYCPPVSGMPFSSKIVIPANSILIFERKN